MKVTMQHTEETIRRLARVQYDTFCLAQKLLVFLFGAGLVWLGVTNRFDSTTSLVMIAMGCWTITGINASPNRNAKKMIEYAKGNLPKSEYTFQKESVLIYGDGQQTKLAYKDIYSLVQDEAYFYLFISKYSAYMVPLAELKEEQVQELKQMLEGKCGRRFERPGSLWSLSLKTLSRSFRK